MSSQEQCTAHLALYLRHCIDKKKYIQVWDKLRVLAESLGGYEYTPPSNRTIPAPLVVFLFEQGLSFEEVRLISYAIENYSPKSQEQALTILKELYNESIHRSKTPEPLILRTPNFPHLSSTVST